MNISEFFNSKIARLSLVVASPTVILSIASGRLNISLGDVTSELVNSYQDGRDFFYAWIPFEVPEVVKDTVTMYFLLGLSVETAISWAALAVGNAIRGFRIAYWWRFRRVYTRNGQSIKNWRKEHIPSIKLKSDKLKFIDIPAWKRIMLWPLTLKLMREEYEILYKKHILNEWIPVANIHGVMKYPRTVERAYFSALFQMQMLRWIYLFPFVALVLYAGCGAFMLALEFIVTSAVKAMNQ